MPDPAASPVRSSRRSARTPIPMETDPMPGLSEHCPGCGRHLVISRFDTTFRMSDASEQLCFAVPGGLCKDCHQLYLDPELVDRLDLGDGRCVFAIESDVVLQERAGSWAD
jgi:hypothetical protein